MKSRPAQYLIMVSAACWLILFQINLAVAEEQTSAPLLMCPSHEEMVAELADRAEVLQRIKLELEDLAAGRKMSEKAIEALLLVDPENEQAVGSRRQELRESTGLAPPAATPGLDKVIRCALQDKQLKDSATFMARSRVSASGLFGSRRWTIIWSRSPTTVSSSIR